MTREETVVRTFVELADTLVETFDVIDMLTVVTDRCTEVLDVDAAGLLLSSPDGALGLVAASSEIPGLTLADGDWTGYVSAAAERGFSECAVLPLRLRGTVLGTLNLVCATDVLLSETNRTVAQAFADVASISLLQHRAAREQKLVTDQLQHALDSRVVIEQAKGVLAERDQVSLDEAFRRMRAYARSHNLNLGQVAEQLTRGDLQVTG